MGACASRPVVADDDHRSVLRDESLLAPRGTHSYDGYVDPVDLATQMKSFRRQVQRKSLAPFWPPRDDETDEAGESCPICTCYYKSVNVTTCCQFKICSECHARHVNSFAFGEKGTRAFGAPRRRNSYRDRIFTSRRNANTTTANARTARKRRRMMKPTCVCCRKEGYTVMYLGVRTRKERERDAEEKRRIDTSLARAKLGIDEETRRRQSLFSSAVRDEGKEEERSTVVAIPKGWEEEYEMARLAEEGGSPRAREDAAAFEERNFSRGALNERNSSSFMSMMPSQRTSFLRGRSEMFAEMYDAFFHEEGNTRRSRRSFDLGSRRNLPDFRRNSEDFFENGALPPLNESGDDTATTTADNSTQHSQQQQQQQQQHSRRLVNEFRNMVLEELYLSEALYRSMLDVHEDGEHVQNRINGLREGNENNSETEEASDAEEGEYDENRVEVVAEEEKEEEEEEGATTRDASSEEEDDDDDDDDK